MTPCEYALRFVCPMSSPKMTRMLGFLWLFPFALDMLVLPGWRPDDVERAVSLGQ
jgi:hypothetical protein